MSLTLMGAGASYEFRWRRWALVRDCVVHHLERGEAGSRFPLFESIGSALGETEVKLDPADLASELRAIQSQLRTLAVDDLVMGPETASVLYPGVRAPTAARPLTQSERGAAVPRGAAENLGDYFDVFFSSALAVCEHAEQKSVRVEVVDL